MQLTVQRLGLLLLLRMKEGLMPLLAMLTSSVYQMVMHLALQDRGWTALGAASSQTPLALNLMACCLVAAGQARGAG
jgi:hypothetical protein